MKLFATNRRIKNATGSFVNNESGAVAAYVVILLAVLVGFVGLAVDVGRLYTTHSQAQAAADAAALAAATQLDGKADAIERATIAAMTTPLVNNNQDFAQGDATVQIVRLRFLHSLPAHDDLPITDANVTTNPAKAAYVEATTETLTQFNAFLAAVGAGSSDTLAAAVAGNTTMQCEIPPLMICNPWEPPLGEPYNPDVDALNTLLNGVTLLAKTKGKIDNWAEGNAGLLDPPPACKEEVEGVCTEWDWSSNTGTKAVTLAMARVPQDYCYPNMPLSVRTGQAAAMRSAVNTWFDIYEEPHLGKDEFRTDPDFRPARNVTKGYITDWVTKDIVVDGVVTGTESVCESTLVNDPAIAMGLPPDDCFAGGVDFSDPIPCATGVGPTEDSKDRIGDGNWSMGLAAYLATNHPTDEFTVAAGATRYDVYRAEIAQGMIPDNKSGLNGGPTNGEDGTPICYKDATGTVVPNDEPDRRVLSIAVINCLREDVTGNSTPNVEAEFFVDMFVLRPIRGGSDGNIWLEFIDIKDGGDEATHDIVQLYR